MSYILPLEELVNSGSNSNCFQHSSIKSISFSWNKINPFLGSLSAFNMNTSFAFLQWKRDSSATYRYKLSFEGPKSELTIVAEMGLFDDNVVLGLWFTKKKRFRLRKFIYIYIISVYYERYLRIIHFFVSHGRGPILNLVDNICAFNENC